MLEFDMGENPLRDQLLLEPLLPQGGSIALPTGPGLGIEINPEAIEKFRPR
jgi:D-galactarolactone cycloisomerase